MVSRWAFNTNIANVKWIETIWSNNPFMSKHLASSYRKLLMSESVEDQQPHGALIKFISNLDDENRAHLQNRGFDCANIHIRTLLKTFLFTSIREQTD